MNDKLRKLLLKEIKLQLIHNKRVIRQARNNRDNLTVLSDVDIETENSDQLLRLVELLLKQEKENKKCAHKAE